jgi:hypothetical protein
MGEGNAATKEAKGRTSDGGPGHHLRDGATARAKEEGRQEEEAGDNETQPHHRKWIQEWLALITQLDGTGGHEPLSKMT